MNKSCPNPKTRIVPGAVRYLVLIVFFVVLVVAGCEQDRIANLEAKIAELESEAQAQEQKIKILANIVTLNRASALYPNLRHHFIIADEFWQWTYGGMAECERDCWNNLDDILKSCEIGDVACIYQAIQKFGHCETVCQNRP